MASHATTLEKQIQVGTTFALWNDGAPSIEVELHFCDGRGSSAKVAITRTSEGTGTLRIVNGGEWPIRQIQPKELPTPPPESDGHLATYWIVQR